jgi:predicted metalloprotease with PDZ domain
MSDYFYEDNSQGLVSGCLCSYHCKPEPNYMRRISLFTSWVLITLVTRSQTYYSLVYQDSTNSTLKISIEPSQPIKAVNFIMPRSVPGGYGIYDYDKFVDHPYAVTIDGQKLDMIKDMNDAPRWVCKDTGIKISRIEYEVNLDKMERQLLASDASIVRPGFAGILNYSVFGWIDGMERQAAQCSVETFSKWPVFTTLAPSASMHTGSLRFNAESYYALADAQIFMGPNMKVKEFVGLVPLFIASYCQAKDEYLDDYAKQEIISMGILKDYFGELPFSHYSLMLRKAIPLEPVSAPPLAMEHLQSSTFFGDTSFVRTAPMSSEQIMRTIPTFLHHMGHAFIPLRCYGDAYKPYVMEIPPIINNIWFNEGFMWFLPYDTLKSERWKALFTNAVYSTSPLIKKMGLEQLSQIASTMYGKDFRLGRAIYSRGALMAIEMNNYIREKTGGRKSMKDVFRYLYNWAKENKRPFTMEEFPVLINKASGVDVSTIYQRWQLPVE